MVSIWTDALYNLIKIINLMNSFFLGFIVLKKEKNYNSCSIKSEIRNATLWFIIFQHRVFYFLIICGRRANIIVYQRGQKFGSCIPGGNGWLYRSACCQIFIKYLLKKDLGIGSSCYWPEYIWHEEKETGSRLLCSRHCLNIFRKLNHKYQGFY